MSLALGGYATVDPMVGGTLTGLVVLAGIAFVLYRVRRR